MAASTSNLSFADKIREIAKAAREQGKTPTTTEDWRETKKIEDINKFFKSEVANGAMKKIEERAFEGCLSANIYEYHFSAYFGFNKEGKLVTLPEFDKNAGFYMHRIHHVVQSDLFQEKLKELITSFGGNMQYDSWYPGRDKINVVTVFWGPTKTHKYDLIWGTDAETPSEKGSDEPEKTVDQEDAKPPASTTEVGESSGPRDDDETEEISFKSVVKKGKGKDKGKEI